jgi:hypothetical protein
MNNNSVDKVSTAEISAKDEVSREALREEAIHEAAKPDVKSNGESPLDFPRWISDAAGSFYNRTVETHPPLEKFVSAVIDRARGISAEVLAKYSALKSEIAFSNFKEIDFSESVLMDPAEFTRKNKFRKDMALVEHFFDHAERPELIKEVSDENLAMMKDLVLESMVRGSSRVKVRELVFSKLKKLPGTGGYNLEYKSQRAEINRILDSAFNYVYKKGPPLSPEKNASLYESTTIPDYIVVDERGKGIAALEIKANTPKEFIEYVEQLEKEFELWKNASPLLRPERFDLQVEMPYTEGPTWERNISEGMKLGVSTGGIRKTLQIINNDMSIDLIDEKTGEITSAPPNHIINYPLIIAIPSDAPQEYVDRLGKIVNDADIKNIQIRKIPFSSAEINMYSVANLMRYYTNPRTVKKLGIPTYDELIKKNSKGGYIRKHGELYEDFFDYFEKSDKKQLVKQSFQS